MKIQSSVNIKLVATVGDKATPIGKSFVSNGEQAESFALTQENPLFPCTYSKQYL